MESILYRNKRNTYSIDNSVIKAAANEGKPASAYIERIMCSRDGRLFEKVPNEPRYTCNGEVIERGVKEDLQVCIKNLNEAMESGEKVKKVKKKNPFYKEVEISLKEFLGRKVKVVGKNKNKGTLQIEFYSEDDLMELTKLLERE